MTPPVHALQTEDSSPPISRAASDDGRSEGRPALHVAITGMVGLGKTSLATALAPHLQAELVMESVGVTNPWLHRYTAARTPEDRRAAWLPLQLHFLTDRIEALRRMARLGGRYVADQYLGTDWGCFVEGPAREGLLDAADVELLRRVRTQYDALPGLGEPDCLIYLTGPFELAMERLRARGRPNEAETPDAYWSRLAGRYDELVAAATCPVLRVDVRSYDLVRQPDSVAAVIAQLRAQVGVASVSSASRSPAVGAPGVPHPRRVPGSWVSTRGAR
jgi:deoxyadenosine/deoxycytidine kinase